ncbi:hypothetical protein C4569_02405 [Candidatus Parcubacteria bacterium]|nr:MAG: hypothetical protein C4569_02405 [Candidatus Parcubacteria bacterium]
MPIYPIIFWRDARLFYQRGLLVQTWKKYGPDVKAGLKWKLLGGIASNWNERTFYKKSKLKILAPTVFSFFGLVNIQKTGDKVPMEPKDVYCQFLDLTNLEAGVSTHTFYNNGHFFVIDGHIVIVDYGNPRIHPVLVKYDDKIYEEFNFFYSKWSDAYKRQLIH